MQHLNDAARLMGNFDDIVAQYESKGEMIDSLAKEPSKLAQLFGKSVEAKDYDSAFQIADKIKTLDNSKLPLAQILEVVKVAGNLLYDDEARAKRSESTEIRVLMDTLALQQLTIKDSLTLLKSSFEALERGGGDSFDEDSAAELTPAEVEAERHTQELCLKLLSSQGIILDLQEDFDSSIATMCENPRLEDVSLDGRLKLCQAIAVQGRSAVAALAKNFDMFHLGDEDAASRLKQWAMIAEEAEAAAALAENLDKLPLNDVSAAERLSFCYAILDQGSEAAAALAENLNMIPLEDVAAAGRLELSWAIVAQGEEAACKLGRYIDKLLLEDVAAAERLRLFQAIIAKGSNAASALAFRFADLNLDDVAALDRLNLCKALVAQGAATSLAISLGVFNLGDVTAADRLELYQAIVAKGNYVAVDLASHADKLLLGDVAVAERLGLCRAIIAQGDDAAAALADNFEKFNLGDVAAAERLGLCQAIVAKGSLGASAIAVNFHKFNLGDVATAERLKLCQDIVARGSEAAEALTKNFEKFNLGDVATAERLKLCQDIVARGSEAAEALTENFEKFNLGDLATAELLKLCKNIVAKGDDPASALASNIEKFNLGDIAAVERLKLCQKIVAQGKKSASALAYNIGKFNLADVTVAERLQLCQDVVQQGGRAPAALVLNFDMFNLGDLAAAERLTLCQAIVAKGKSAAAEALASNFDKFNLGDVPAAERLKLCQVIVAQGEVAAAALASNFDGLPLGDVAATDILKLCQDIIAQGGWIAAILADKLDALTLGDVAAADRLGLYQAIVAQGEDAAAALAYNVDKLRLGDVAVAERLTLYQAIIAQGGMAANALAERFDQLGLEELMPEQQAIFLESSAEVLVSGYPFLQKLCAGHPAQLQMVLDTLLNKLNAADTPPEEQLSLAQAIFAGGQSTWNLDIDHPLMQAAISIISVSEAEEKNPFRLYAALRVLQETPSPYQPPKVFIDADEATINLPQLKSLGIEIERKDLPENVSLASFQAFFDDLKLKVTAGANSAEEALQSLGTTWAEVSVPIEVDPERLLLNLLAKTEGAVSESEAKLRAVLKNIFDKSQDPVEDAFFNEQEEVFIKTMMAIQNCEGGKKYGIAFAYEQLAPEYRYKATMTKLLSQAEFMAEQEKNATLAQISTFLEENKPEGTDAATFLSASSVEPQWTNRLTGWASKLFADDPRRDDFVIADASLMGFEISPECATEVVAMLKQTAEASMAALVAPLVAQSVQKVLSAQFSGANALMQELTGEEDVEQAPHQVTYLQNLIGPPLGTHTVAFDRHTGVLYDALVERSREEVLGIFFKYFTPEALVNALTRDLKTATADEKGSLQKLLPGEQYWQDPDTINRQGALALLRRFQYLV